MMGAIFALFASDNESIAIAVNFLSVVSSAFVILFLFWSTTLFIGPFRGGRSAAVVGVPGNPNLFYFGATGGGIWKTENGGETYKNPFDLEDLP